MKRIKSQAEREVEDLRSARRQERHIRNFNSVFLNAETPPLPGMRDKGARRLEKKPTLDCLDNETCEN